LQFVSSCAQRRNKKKETIFKDPSGLKPGAQRRRIHKVAKASYKQKSKKKLGPRISISLSPLSVFLSYLVIGNETGGGGGKKNPQHSKGQLQMYFQIELIIHSLIFGTLKV